MSAKRVVVVGAGINGAASAIWLRRAGVEVTVIDKQPPGNGASFGNGGVLASSAVIPVTVPGLIATAPKYLLNAESPLFLRWSYLPRLLPWLVRFLSHANDADTRRIAGALNQIIGDSLEQHLALTEGLGARKWVRASEYSFVYTDRAAFEADHYAWSVRKTLGFVPELVEGDAVQAREPILGPMSRFMAVLPDHGYIPNPNAYVSDLIDDLVAMGGRFVQAEVRDLQLDGGHVTGVETDQGRIACDAVVMAAGVWSKGLMERLGLKVPLEAERGYHVHFAGSTERPNAPMMLSAAKFVATPMEDGMRCAGIVEFGGLSEVKSKAPLKLLRRKIKAFLPGLEATREEEWLGFRPSTPDSLPMIGEVGQTGVFAAFGHQHIGLTGGAKTGRLVADLITGRAPNSDISAFDPHRFGKA